MPYRHLGRSGLKVSALSFGAWVTFGEQVEEDIAAACMQAAYDHGVNFFDNAEEYGSGRAETVMGRILQKKGWKRSDLVLSTKIFWGDLHPNGQGLSRKHIVEGTEASLERLQVEYVDLIYCHRPDPDTPIEETVRAMNHVINTGRAFYWGTSEWSAEEIRAAHGIARRERLIPPAMEQPKYNMFVRERVEKEYRLLYRDIGLGLTTFSPLASGMLTGKYNNGIPDESRLALEEYDWLRKRLESDEGQDRIARVRRLTPIAEKLGCTMAQLALAWCLRNPNVSSVITGASRPEQVEENMKALQVLEQLTPKVVNRIEAVLDNEPKLRVNFRRA